MYGENVAQLCLVWLDNIRQFVNLICSFDGRFFFSFKLGVRLYSYVFFEVPQRTWALVVTFIIER